MEPLKEHVRSKVENHPIRSIIILWIMGLPLVVFLAFSIANHWKRNFISAQIAIENEELVLQVKRVSEMVVFKFDVMKKYASLFSINREVISALFTINNFVGLTDYIHNFSNVLHLRIVFILDRNGVCVASNDNENFNMVGTDLSDREYFKAAISGKNYSQFVVGRVSDIPSFHFAVPVQVGSEVLGVVVLVLDTETLAQQLYIPTGFITDDSGVVILDNESGSMLKVVPGKAAAGFEQKENQLRYQRDRLEPVYLQEYDVDGIQLWRLSEGGDPHIFQGSYVKNCGLYIYSFSNVSGILNDGEAIFIRYFCALIIAIGAGAAFIIGTITNLIRDKYMRISLQHLNDQLKHLAQYDSLTGLLNRRMFDEAILTYFAQARRLGTSFALIIFDIDYFKMLNDVFGHQEGDRVLKEVATCARSALTRETDRIFRIGGEEFAVIVLAKNDSQVTSLMEILRSAVERLGITHPDHPGAVVTVSLGGVLVKDGAQTTATGLFKKADDALYEAKSTGRNRAVLARRL